MLHVNEYFFCVAFLYAENSSPFFIDTHSIVQDSFHSQPLSFNLLSIKSEVIKKIDKVNFLVNDFLVKILSTQVYYVNVNKILLQQINTLYNDEIGPNLSDSYF